MIKIPIPNFQTWHETLVKSEYRAEVIFHDEVYEEMEIYLDGLSTINKYQL